MRKTLSLLLALVATATSLSLLSAPVRDSLSSRHTSFFDPAPAPFDPDLGFTEGIYLDSNGNEVSAPDSFVTRHIPVTPGVLTFRSPTWASGQLPNNRGYLVQYDSFGHKTDISRYFRASSASGIDPIDITIKSNTATIRFCCGRSDLYSIRYPLWARYGEVDYLIYDWLLVDRL